MLQGILPLVIGIVVGPVFLNLILNPSLTQRAIDSTEALSDGAKHGAQSILREVAAYWNLSGEREKYKEWRGRTISIRTRKFVAKQLKKHSIVDEDEIRAGVEKGIDKVWEPTIGIIVGVWTRRAAYLVLVGFLMVGEYLLTEPVTPVLIGTGQQPPSPYILYAQAIASLLKHTQLLTGVVLMSCIALAAMLIEEYTNLLPVAMRAEPYISRTTQIISLALAIAMFAVNISAVTAFAIVGIDFHIAREFPVSAAFAALVGVGISITLGILLARRAMGRSLSGILWFILGALAASLVYLVAMVLATGALILRGLHKLSRLLGSRSASRDSRKPDTPGKSK